MNSATKSAPNTKQLNQDFLEEYNSESSIKKYTAKTAGYGISYLLDHDYGNIYLRTIEKYVPKSRLQSGIRLWEFGCGGGMNLLHLVSMLERKNIPIEFACGTDFSETLISAARNETKRFGNSRAISNVRFAVARNEDLVDAGAKGLGVDKDKLTGSFDIIFGVNTIRYNHRLNNVEQCVADISRLLRDGGICINIDMNQKFPAFRSRLKDHERVDSPEETSTYLPSLEEYAKPFAEAGLEILSKKNFCWIPHSASRKMTNVMRVLTPVLNTVAGSRGMRSLVIARKNSKSAR